MGSHCHSALPEVSSHLCKRDHRRGEDERFQEQLRARVDCALVRSILELMEHTMAHGTCDVCGLVNVAGSIRRPARAICQSPAMQDLFHRAARFARSDAPVMILGESGAGKEIVARVLHANSPRARKPFVAVNVAALPSELLESELFGHVRGAFTGAAREKRGLFQAADAGVLFLDEIGDMPLPLQAKLLRALQDGEVRRVGDTRTFAVDVRVVCATHQALPDLVRRKRFREDLYYRLKVLSLEVPPLRQRKEDILPLASQFLALERSSAAGFSPGAQQALLAYSWPGNVRELENAVKHGAALAAGDAVERAHLPDDVVRRQSNGSEKVSFRSLADVEQSHILAVLESCNGSMTEAAAILGIARNTLWRKLKSYA
jgi:two-component system response regulator HydG